MANSWIPTSKNGLASIDVFWHPLSVARVFVTSDAEFAATKPFFKERIPPVTQVLRGDIAGSIAMKQFADRLHRYEANSLTIGGLQVNQILPTLADPVKTED